MSINNGYDVDVIKSIIANALENFYSALIKKVNGLKINDVIKRKNPYLFRAKAMNGASQIVDAILSAFVSSSEETIFGNEFIEPLAIAASKGQKSLSTGLDISIEREDVIYGIAVKSGTSVFNSSSKTRQEQNFMAAQKLANQAKKRFEAIIGYSYGKKTSSGKGIAKIYTELAGQKFWEKLTGDKTFYVDIIRYMDKLPEKYIEEFDHAYQLASNRLVKEFTNEFCLDDGSIDWIKLVEFNSGAIK